MSVRRALWVRVIVNYEECARYRNCHGLAVPQVGDQIIGTREESEPGVVVGARDVAVSIVFGGTYVDHDVKATMHVPGWVCGAWSFFEPTQQTYQPATKIDEPLIARHFGVGFEG